MSKLRIAPALAALFTAAVLASAAASASPSGLYGTVRAGPTQPVCVADEPCDKAVRVKLVFSRLATGEEAARTRSTAAGRFRLRLPAGYYKVRTVERIGIDRNIEPRRVRVRADRFSRIVFRIDTGIR
jgi:hypothetical protein